MDSQKGQNQSKQVYSSSFSKYLPLVVIAVVFAILASAGTYLASKQSNTQPVSQNIVPNYPTPTPDPTANWKTYNGDAYKFLVKYPGDWIITPFTAEYYKKYLVAPQYMLLVAFLNKTAQQGISAGNPGIISINISRTYLKPNESFADFINTRTSDLNLSTPKPLSISDDVVSINSIQAHKVAYTSSNQITTEVYIPKEDGSVYVIDSLVRPEDLFLQKKFLDPMISTFKFTP